MDAAVEYMEMMDRFLHKLNGQVASNQWVVEKGRKFDKVYHVDSTKGNYMVDRRSRVIYGTKSKAQVNPRRMYGTLETVNEFDWQVVPAVPFGGTLAAEMFEGREAEFRKTYKPRGRPRKNP
jgi:hypothetical protein